MGRKQLKGFAHNLAHQFAFSAEHYAWLAYRYRLPAVTIDLLEARIEPVEFDIERNRILAGICRQTLIRSAGRLTPPGAVVSALLYARFGIDDYSKDGCRESIGRSVFTVILTDDRGKEWRGDYAWESMLMLA